MAVFSGVPITGTIVYTTAAGKVTEANVTPVQTSWIESSQKSTQLEPPFVPGVFLVKPYSVSSIKTHSEQGEVKTSYVRPSDGLHMVATYVIEHPRVASVIPIPSMLNNACGDVSSHSQLALQEAYAKVEEARWDALMDLAELGETMDTLVMLLKALAKPALLPKMLKDFVAAERENATKRQSKRNKRHEYGLKDMERDAKKGSKAAADGWLTWRYGIMPIVYSIQDLLELLEDDLEKASDAIRTKRRKRQIPGQERTQRGTVSQSCNYTIKGNARVEAIVYYRRLVDESLRSALGFKPENIPGLLWEVTSKSFVWDWFFHLGDWIAAMKPKTAVHILGDSISVKKEAEIGVTSLFRSPQGNVWAASKPCIFRSESFLRTVDNGVAKPQFTGVDDMNLQRYIDSAALATKPLLGLLRRKRQSP